MANVEIRIKLREHINSSDFTLSTTNNDKAKINNIGLKPTSGTTFGTKPSNLQGMQVLSFATIYFDRNQQNEIIKTKSFKFNESGILCNFDGQVGHLQSEVDTNEIVFGVVPDSGLYSVEFDISNSTGLSSIVILGDKLANQFPTEYTVDGTPFYSDDYKLVIPIDKTQDTHTIILNKWNRTNYNACISEIRATMEEIVYQNTEIDTIKSVERSNVNATEINYGVLANSGSVELIDNDGEIKDMVQDGVLPNSNIPIDIYFNNTLLQNHISNDSNYDTTQGLFNLSLSNKIEMLDKLKYEGFAYPENSLTLYAILKMVMSSLLNETLDDTTTGKFKTMLNNKCMTHNGEQYIYEYLQDIVVQYPVIEYGYTYRQVLDDICKIAQLNLFIDKTNNYKFISARPLLLENEVQNALRITQNVLKEPPSYDLIMKNKYEAVEISENKVNVDTDIDKIINTYKSEQNPTIDSDTDFAQIVNNWNNILINDYTYLKEAKNDASIISEPMILYGTTITKCIFYNTTITIPKKINYNLSKIIDVLNGVDKNDNSNIKYIVNYRYYEGTTEEIWGSDIIYTDNYNSTFTTGSRTLATYTTIKTHHWGDDDSEVNDETNLKITTITEDNNNYYCNCNVLAGYECKYYNYAINPPSSSISSNIGYCEKYVPVSIEISFYGTKQTISFEDNSVSSANVNTSEVVANFGNTNTKLLQDQTTYNGTKMTDIIKDNILNDYKYGVSNLRLELFTTDLKDENGVVKKVANSGQVLNAGDVVFLSNDKDRNNQRRYWCVYDNQYGYDGTLDESVKFYQKREYYGLYNEQTFLGWHYLISNGDIEVRNENNENVLYINNKLLKGKLIINSNVTKIGSQSFLNCTGLTSIIIPESVKYISYDAFKNCTGLINISIPNNIISIDEDAFYGCSSLVYNEYENGLYLGNVGNPYLVLVKAKNTNITTCTINSNTKIIYQFAFENCTSLTSITIPNNTNIYYGTFKDCTNLTSVTFENTSGWKISEYLDMSSPTDISSSDLENTTTAATYLTSTYKNYYWRRYTT